MMKFYMSASDNLVMVEGAKAWQWDQEAKRWHRADGLSAEVTGHGGSIYDDISRREATEKYPNAFKVVDDS